MILIAWGLKSSQSYGQNFTEKVGLGQWCNFMLQKFSCGHSYLGHHHRWWLRYTKTKQQSAVSIMFLGDPPCKIQEIKKCWKAKLWLPSLERQSLHVASVLLLDQCTVNADIYKHPWLLQLKSLKRGLRGVMLYHNKESAHTATATMHFHHWTAAGSLPILLSKPFPVWLVPNPTPTSEKALWVQGTRVESQGSH